MDLNVPFGKKVGFLKEGESSLEHIADRVCPPVADVEKKEKRDEWLQKFKWVISEGYLIPAGRILRNITSTHITNIRNCFITYVEDSIQSIAKLNHDITLISAYGGGFGVNFSLLRPEGDELKTKGGLSTGPVSFMRMVDGIGGEMRAGGSRKSAGLVCLEVSHPDIYKFIEAKLGHHTLQNLNISVGITNEFITAVRNDSNWDLKFNGKIYRTIKAKDLWEYLVECSLKSAEPGWINLSNINYWNPGSYYERNVLSNPCQEINGEPFTSCALSNINFHKLVESGKFNYDKLSEIVTISHRFLDNIVTLGEFPLQENKSVAERGRRIGLGCIGHAHALVEMKIRYGSEEHLEFIDKVYSVYRDSAYLASISVAEEKGYFPAFTSSYLDTPWAKRLPRLIRNKIKLHGLRNVAVLACPPTGDTGIFTNLSTGIEPMVSIKYKRAGKHNFIDPMYEKYGDVLEYKPYFVGMYEVTPREHLEVQSKIQQYVDNSISKTINIKKGNEQEFRDVILSEIQNVKGTTVYVQGSRKEHIEVESIGECTGGVCNLDEPVITGEH